MLIWSHDSLTGGDFSITEIDLERAISIGLLPELDRERFYSLGKDSLLSCQISLTDHRRFSEQI